MNEENLIRELLESISHLNHRQWEMLKINVDIAFNAKIKNETISFNEELKNIICEDLIMNK